MIHDDVEFLRGVVKRLTALPAEDECVEFKVNNWEPGSIGQYISALSNSAALQGKGNAYLVWGISNDDHAVVGTTFKASRAKKGNEELENWLVRLLAPRINFRFHEISYEEKPVVLLEIEPAYSHPTRFSGEGYIRIGSYNKKLKDHPERERQLWNVLTATSFETRETIEGVSSKEILQFLDYPAYFDLLDAHLPSNARAILDSLARERLVTRSDNGQWGIPNIALVLLAKHLDHISNLQRKALRVIQYRGISRIEACKETVSNRGYASGFEGVIQLINGLLPANEIISNGIRRSVPVYPEIALRELIANALIHQDFVISGTGPMIEIFDDRIEITNPGRPLIEPDRFVDAPPRTRNEQIAFFMRRFGICEERGSGWDKVASQIELFQLPAPKIEVVDEHTRVTLFSQRSLNEMDGTERARATYLHACLQYVKRDYLTNSSLRKRFNIEKHNTAKASRIIADAVNRGVILPDDPDAAPKLMRYVPWWVKDDTPKGS